MTLHKYSYLHTLLPLYCSLLHHFLNNNSKEWQSFFLVLIWSWYALPLSTQFLLAFQYRWFMGCSVMVYREFRNQHGWKPSTPRNSSWAAQFMKLQRRMRRISFVWIVAPVFALIACSSIASIGLFRFVVMCIMMLSDWKTSRSS